MRLCWGLTLLLVIAVLGTPTVAKNSKSKGNNSSSGSGSRQKGEGRRGKASSESGSREIREPEINVQGRTITDTSKSCTDSLAACRIYLIRGLCRFDAYARICPKSCNKCRPDGNSETALIDTSPMEKGNEKKGDQDKTQQKDSNPPNGVSSESNKDKFKGRGSGSHEKGDGQESGEGENVQKSIPTFGEQVKSLLKSRSYENEKSEELKESDESKQVSGARKYIDWFRGRGSKPGSREKERELGSGENGIKAALSENDKDDRKGNENVSGVKKHIDWFRGQPAQSGSSKEETKQVLNERTSNPSSGEKNLKSKSAERGNKSGLAERGTIAGSGEAQISQLSREGNKNKGIGSKIVSAARKYIDRFRGRGAKSEEKAKSVASDEKITSESGKRVMETERNEKEMKLGSDQKSIKSVPSENAKDDGKGNKFVSGVRKYIDWFRGRGAKSEGEANSVPSDEEITAESGRRVAETERSEKEIKLGSDQKGIKSVPSENAKDDGKGNKIVSGVKKYIDWFRGRGAKSEEEANLVASHEEITAESGRRVMGTERSEKEIKLGSGQKGIKSIPSENAKDDGKGNKIVSGVRKYIDWFRGRGAKSEEEANSFGSQEGIATESGKMVKETDRSEKEMKLGSSEREVNPPGEKEDGDDGKGGRLLPGVKRYVDWFRGRDSKKESKEGEIKPESDGRNINHASGEIKSKLGFSEKGSNSGSHATQIKPVSDIENKDFGIGGKIVSGVKKYIDWFRGRGTKSGESVKESGPVASNKAITIDNNEEMLSQKQAIQEARPLEAVEVANKVPEIPSEARDHSDQLQSQNIAMEEERPMDAVEPSEVQGDEPKGDEGPGHQVASGAKRYFDWLQEPRKQAVEESRPLEAVEEPVEVQRGNEEGIAENPIRSPNERIEQTTELPVAESDSDEEYFKQEEFVFPEPKPQPLGMESGVIPDDLITASSHEISHEPAKSRPNSGSAWKPSPSLASGSFLQLDLGEVISVHGLGTRGDPASQHWTRAYIVSTSTDGRIFSDLLDTRDNKTARIFSGNKDGLSWTHHCLHRYYGNPIQARYIRFSPVDWSGSPSLRVEAFGYRRHNDPLLVKALEKDAWTRNVTGCMCYYDNTKFDCACCQPSGCQCPSNNRHQCVQCGYGSSCGVPDAKPRSVQVDAWTKTETGCACHWDQSRTDCACCQNNGCQCGRENKNQCVSCGQPDQCGTKEDIFGPNSYCVPKTCSSSQPAGHR